MALNIENATIGFDANNIQEALNNLNTKCIQDTITKMNQSMDKLRTSVDSAWVGQSADIFKENMNTDKESIIKSLNETYENLRSEMYQIANQMAEADSNLVNRRGE